MHDQGRGRRAGLDAVHAQARERLDAFVGAPPQRQRARAPVAERFQALDNFFCVFAIRPGERIVMPIDAVRGVASARAASVEGHGWRVDRHRRRLPARDSPSPRRGAAARYGDPVDLLELPV